MRFPNKAGDHADTDDILRAELKAAGIKTLQEDAGEPPEFMADLLRSTSGEVKTSVIGVLHGWQFKRAWYYWMAEGPGIEVAAAEALHATHGRDVRVDGHCGCPSPRDRYEGLACGHYHVDTPDGLKALADTIKALVDRATAGRQTAPWTDFSGQPIRDGDVIGHPSGDEGVVVFIASEERPGDQWRVDYGTGDRSRLCLQIGPKGRAVVIKRTN